MLHTLKGTGPHYVSTSWPAITTISKLQAAIVTSIQTHIKSDITTSPSTPAKMASQPPQEPSEQPEAPPNAQPAEEETGYAPLVDPRLPTRKDTSLKEFLAKIDDYAPIVRI